MEHIGIITCGLAFGTPIAIFGALIHMLNHAMVKTLMFFTAGNLALKYHSKDIEHIKGAIQVMPISGLVLLLGGLALSGLPPFSTFVSEFYILRGGIQGHYYLASICFVLLLIIAFGGLLNHFLNMTIGPVQASPTGNVIQISKGELSRSGLIAIIVPLLIVLLFGLWIPSTLKELINEAVKIVSLGGAI